MTPSSSPANPEMPTSEVTPSTGPSVPPAQAQDVGSSGVPLAPFEAALRDPHLWSVVWWNSGDGTAAYHVVPVDEVLRNISQAHAASHLSSFMAVRYARLVRNTEELP